MISVEKSPKFIGYDLKAFVREVLTAWRGMLEWRAFAWLWPRVLVRLFLPDGRVGTVTGLRGDIVEDEKRSRAAPFQAVVLPESLLLRSALRLPKIQPQELNAAIDLQVGNLSPFARSQLVWAHEIQIGGPDDISVHVVLTSRDLVSRHMVQTCPTVEAQDFEVWAPLAAGPGFLMLPGFSEGRRLRRGAIGRWVVAGLAAFAVVLIFAMAMTPSLQLYLRSLQASQAMKTLQGKAVPSLKQRESLVRSTEQLAQVNELVGNPVPPLKTLKLITDALSDDASLLSLQIQGNKVTMSGQTVNSAVLMKQLGSTPGMRDVTAPTPATKPLGAPRESFNIEFTLDPVAMRPNP